jgi:hypothetical protein
MRTPPPDLTDADIAAEVAAGWGLEVTTVSYLPVGFGSHHWRVRAGTADWFATADDLDARRSAEAESRAGVFDRLASALGTARALRDAGLRFVVAPERGRAGGVLRPVGDRFALALYPLVPGRTRPWGRYESVADRMAILRLLVALHRAPAATRSLVKTDDFRVAHGAELVEAMDDLRGPWVGGPFAEPARALLAGSARDVGRILARQHQLADIARAQPERFVLTHGEPHPGNTIQADEGWLLVDWDTVLLAPPERDLWMVADSQSDITEAYRRETGTTILPDLLELYRLTWDLADIADFVTLFRQPHRRTDDTDKAWANLGRRLGELGPSTEQ